MSRIVLGPFLKGITEAAPQPTPNPEPTPTNAVVGIKFGDPATEFGGKVHLAIDPATIVDGATRPDKVYAFYVKADHPDLPPAEQRTVEQIVNSGSPVGFLAIAADTTSFDVVVPGVAPGVYDVHTLIDYPS